MISKNTLKKEVYEDLRYRIITQDLPPGELLKEKELMLHYGIGRSPLRDIFIELQREGLIRRIPRAGTWVAPMDLNFVKQIAEVRVALEALAGELAAKRISEEQLQQLEEILAKVGTHRKNGDANIRELIKYESRFHKIIYAATQNEKLEALLLEFQGVGARLWHYLFFTEEQLYKLFEDHCMILTALKGRDVEQCRKLMAQHPRVYFDQIEGKV
jgi:DNA-binding GntR family transcriptional regulator